MINISDLKPEDKNRKVVYKPSHSSGSLEEGRITSWNDHYIFVDYSNVGRGNATSPDKLEFVSENG